MKVSILAVRPFLDLFARRSGSRERFLCATGIDPSRLDDSHGCLEQSEFDRLLQAALALTGDPALGIHMAERARPPAYDVIGHLPPHTATLRETVECFIRYSRILSDVTATLEEQGNLATIAFNIAAPPESPPARLRAEMVVTGFVRLLRVFCGAGAMPREALFQHAAPPYRAEYTRLFGGTERFEQPVTALRFDRAMLSRGSRHDNPRLKAILTNEADRIIQRLERPMTCAERVREWLAARGPGDAPTMSAAAQQLGMSVRSLRRSLAEQAVSYPKLFKETRAAFAKQLLEDSDRSIFQVAFDMGFSDPSAFHRAFRRWTGMTPSQYRATSR